MGPLRPTADYEMWRMIIIRIITLDYFMQDMGYGMDNYFVWTIFMIASYI